MNEELTQRILEVSQSVARDGEPPLGVDQFHAYHDALMGRSCFFTGPGGNGKTELSRRVVRELRRRGKTVAVTATTGIAAVNAGGVTIHSFLRLGLCNSIDEAKRKQSGDAFSKACDSLPEVDVILVDEASMMRGDYLDMMDWWLRRVAGVTKGDAEQAKPFGGWQILLSGDFLQLPPVIKGKEKVKYRYAFQAPSWAKLAPRCHYLRKGYRQDDAEFRKHLLKVRRGIATEETLDYFNARVHADIPGGEDATELFATNKEADRVNERRLDALPGEEREYVVETGGHPGWQEAIKKNLPCEEILRLKVGAEVIFIKNDKDRRFVNGTRGTVLSLDGGVTVRKHFGDDSDVDVVVTKHTWELKDAHDVVLATAKQYPLLLGWASTIHRAQGLTLDQMKFDPSCIFERSQSYVALSRARSIGGLCLKAPLDASAIRTSKLCVDFYKGLETIPDLDPAELTVHPTAPPPVLTAFPPEEEAPPVRIRSIGDWLAESKAKSRIPCPPLTTDELPPF